MSIYGPSFAPTNRYGANPNARPFAPGGMAGRRPFATQVDQHPAPKAQPHGKKHGVLKTLFYGGAVAGLSVLALRRFSPENYAKLAEAASKYTPAQAGEFKNYLTAQAGKLKENNLIASALTKAEPVTNSIKSFWKKLVG